MTDQIETMPVLNEVFVQLLEEHVKAYAIR